MEQSDDDESVTIQADGDVYLRVAYGGELSPPVRYRVSMAKLQDVSSYFGALFDPTKFEEGVELAAYHPASRMDKRQPTNAATQPVVSVLDAGVPLKHFDREIFAAFLRCAHQPATLVGLEKWSSASIYKLACIADRFMARDILKDSMQNIRSCAKHSPRGQRKNKVEISERVCRQNLIIGLWYGFEEWVSYFSWRLILHGSKQWDEGLPDETEATKEMDDLGLWHLPENLEDELEYRRACILETLGSIQDTLVGRYLAKERVCRSGLDSSMQCDLFQLGQALRFLSRKELVCLRSLATGQDFKTSSSDSLLKICAALLECPSYQLDGFHQNCGLRTRLVRCVEILQQHISTDAYIGICMACWRSRRPEHSWSNDPTLQRRGQSEGGVVDGRKTRHSDHGRQIVGLFAHGSFVERCESGWRPHNWRYQWMHDGVAEDGGGAISLEAKG